MAIRRRHPFLVLLIVVFIPIAAVMTIPWAFHMGGRWTPLLTWWGSGRLVTKGGNQYPFFVSFHPSSGASRLRLDGRRPTSGVGGTACLCTSPGTSQYLNLSGTIYDTWRSTEGSLIAFRLLEPMVLDVGQKRAGFIDLIGTWRGPELAMEDRASYPRVFRSGLRIDHASVTLRWHPYWSCKSACESAGR